MVRILSLRCIGRSQDTEERGPDLSQHFGLVKPGRSGGDVASTIREKMFALWSANTCNYMQRVTCNILEGWELIVFQLS